LYKPSDHFGNTTWNSGSGESQWLGGSDCHVYRLVRGVLTKLLGCINAGVVFFRQVGLATPLWDWGLAILHPAVHRKRFPGIATQARQTRSSMLEVIRSDYVVTARAKGLSEFPILVKHALPNALLPVITVIGNGMGMALAGTVVIESIFSIPGVGMYLVGGINTRDYAIVQSSVIFLAIWFTLVMLFVDLAYAFIDPRVKTRFAVKKRRKQHA